MAATDAVGRYGERVALRHLEASGWIVLARNWRCARPEMRGEVDIVALDGATAVVVEVKTRRGARSGTGLEAVTPAKLARLRRLAGAWLDERRRVGECRVDGVRVDVVAVERRLAGAATVRHVRGVA